MAEKDEAQSNKISAAFRAHLAGLKAHGKVRAILLLRTDQKGRASRRSRGSRSAIIDATRRSAGDALPYIDKVIEKFGGKRLADSASALGSVPIETTSEGIKALAELEQVKAILEDQPISSLPRVKQA